MRIDQLDNIDNEKVDLLSNEGSVFPNTQVRSIMPKNKNGNKQKRLAKKITRDSSPANPTVETVEDDEFDSRKVKANVMKHLTDMYTDAKKDGGYTSQNMRFALGDLLHDLDMAGYRESDYSDIQGFFHKGIDVKTEQKINMGLLKKAYKQAKNLDVATESMLSQVVREADEKPYICVHADKGKHECHATSSYGAAKKAAEHWGLKSTSGIDAHLAVDESAMIEEHTKYALIRYPDTAISYIKNDGNGWEHIYDRSYGYKGPVDKDDMQYASHIEKEKIPSRMFKEAEHDPQHYRDLDKGQLNHTKSMLMKTAGQLNVAIEQRYKFSKEMMGTGDRVGTGDLQNMLDTLNQLIDGWEESTKIYGK